MAKKTSQIEHAADPKLRVAVEEARSALRARVAIGKEFVGRQIRYDEDLDEAVGEVRKWKDYNATLLRKFFDTPEVSDKYTRITGGAWGIINPTLSDMIEDHQESVRLNLTHLESLEERLDLYELSSDAAEPSEHDPATTVMRRLEQICDKFHIVARQLRSRHDTRDTIDVKDEYDVQDLMHALLLLDFEDVRPEEYTPSYAGKASRIDFLLKREQIVIEVKMTRSGLGAKEVGDQLAIDIQRYQSHPDCKTLVCFVYDPHDLVANPRGIESDLDRDGRPFPVAVLIRPM